MDRITFNHFDAHDGVAAFATTRLGGVSNKPFDTLNLGFSTGDDRDDVLANRARVAKALGASPERIVTAGQVHGTNVAVVRESDAGSLIRETDALVTDVPGLPLLILTADCVAVLLCDTRRRAVGIAHAGWRGTLANIVGATVETMHDAFGTKPSDLIAAVGPSIGPCCYEVGAEVVDAFFAEHAAIADEILQPLDFASAGSFEAGVNEDHRILDLWRANALMLIDAGVPEGNIDIAEACTAHNTAQFFSHRAEGGRTGRSGAVIMLS